MGWGAGVPAATPESSPGHATDGVPASKYSQQQGLSLSLSTGNQFLEESMCYQMFSFGD